MYIEGETLLDCWKKANDAFVLLDPSVGMYMSSRDYTRVVPGLYMVAKHGFGFNPVKNEYVDMPGFYAKYGSRIQLLAKRYVDPLFWDEGIIRLKSKQGKLTKTNPLSFAMQFHRRETRERKVPTGGGCLQSATFAWVYGKWQLHIHLRASEITAALSGDIAFMEWIVRQVRSEVKLRDWNDDFEIHWTIALASQMKSIIPLYLLYSGGDEKVVTYMYRDPSKEHAWFADVINYFWNTFIYIEKTTWHRRQRWVKQFLNKSDIEWSSLHRKWKKEYANL